MQPENRASSAVRATVIVPTRNRARLAARAAGSVIDQQLPNVQVLISDNSTSPSEQRELEATIRTWKAPLRYVRPPEPMPMVKHWAWALDQALVQPDVSHVIVLTDRMLFKPGQLGELLQRAQQYPNDVISYNYDTVDDVRQPVLLEQEEWSGQLLEVESARLLWLTSRLIHSNGLPRLLNSITPRQVIQRVARRFGSVFASVSPDVCFAYRCLGVVDHILYYDKAILIQYAMDRSNGASYRRGVHTDDDRDFVAALGGGVRHASAPVPELETLTNAVIHEYCFVRAEAKSDRYPELDTFSYFGANGWDISQMENPQQARRMWAVLRRHGWTRAHQLTWLFGKALVTARRTPKRFAWLVRGRRFVPRRPFPSTDAAIEYAIHAPLPQATDLAHCWQLEARPLDKGVELDAAA